MHLKCKANARPRTKQQLRTIKYQALRLSLRPSTSQSTYSCLVGSGGFGYMDHRLVAHGDDMRTATRMNPPISG